MKNYLALCPSYKLKLYLSGLKCDSNVCYNLEDMSLEVVLRLGSYLPVPQFPPQCSEAGLWEVVRL